MKIGKEEIMYAPVNIHSGDIDDNSLHYYAKVCRRITTDQGVYTWEQLYKLGWRIKKVKVLITEIE